MLLCLPPHWEKKPNTDAESIIGELVWASPNIDPKEDGVGGRGVGSTFVFCPSSLPLLPQIKLLSWPFAREFLHLTQQLLMVDSFPSSFNHFPWDGATSFHNHNQIWTGFQESPHVNQQTVKFQQRGKSAIPNAGSYSQVDIWYWMKGHGKKGCVGSGSMRILGLSSFKP